MSNKKLIIFNGSPGKKEHSIALPERLKVLLKLRAAQRKLYT
jgi:hypothetical protein